MTPNKNGALKCSKDVLDLAATDQGRSFTANLAIVLHTVLGFKAGLSSTQCPGQKLGQLIVQHASWDKVELWVEQRNKDRRRVSHEEVAQRQQILWSAPRHVT